MERVVIFFLCCSFLLLTTVTSQQDNLCSRPELDDNIETAGIQRFIKPGVEVALSCREGYTPVSGPRKIVCTVRGKWTKTKFQCIPKNCPYPDPIFNGEMNYEDTVYQSIINYTCNEGFILTGSSSAVCIANGTWSSPAPDCKPVTCGLAPIPLNGIVVYDKRVRGATTNYGTIATYACRPPYALPGKVTAECTASGNWTEIPECQLVTCPPPESIERGYMSNNDKREFDYMEKIRYDCRGNYVLEGIPEIVCQNDGKWSETPSCNAPCSVGIEKGRILYKGEKIWIKDLQPNIVLHKEIVSVYCMNTAMNCGFTVPTQCINGTLKIPECFKEPGGLKYTLHSDSLPSEIKEC